ncbi:MAG TPA: histidine kinase [Terriglobales bacterium]|jgi:two-component system sensor histidine kinase KdpD
MPARGKLIVYLGYAAGVGKTFKMLSEAQRLRAQGVDVVVGYFEPHGRQDTIALMRGLATVPRRVQEYRGVSFSEMDTDAVLARQPAVCVVDELAHTNAPGSPRAKRWQDVECLLDHGIDVLANMNVQHLESLNDQIWRISGVRVQETVPDWVVAQANEVVMVDLTPRALVHRLQRGVVYPAQKAERALAHFFRESTLGALRELALRQTAHITETQQEPLTTAPGASHDRILIHITADPSAAMVIRRGKRVADYLHANCRALYVRSSHEGLTPAAAMAAERHLSFARNLRIETRSVAGEDAATTLVDFARQHRITQIFTARPVWPERSGGNRDLVNHIVRLASDMQVTIVARRGPKPS